MNGTLEGNSKSRQRNWVLAGFGFLILYLLWLVWGQVDSWERVLAGSLSIVFAACLAIALALQAGHTLRATANGRLAWRWIAAGILIELTAGIVWQVLSFNSSGASTQPNL